MKEARKKRKIRDVESRRIPTVALAVPSSVIENAQTAELATYLSGQIARTAAIFRIDEIVVLDDSFSGQVSCDGTYQVVVSKRELSAHPRDLTISRDGRLSKGAAFLARILQYQETPQYLRRALIPMHSDLKLVGLLPPLDAPHHMRAEEWCQFREGLVLKSDADLGSIVNVGLDQDALLEEAVMPGVRITVHIGAKAAHAESELAPGRLYRARLASLQDPREQLGMYWGYQTRIASSVKDLLDGGPHEGGYDVSVGTSEHGSVAAANDFKLPAFKHLLVVFGGPLGLEDLFSKDKSVERRDPRDSFDMYINTCPGQGSRTIRTEEALLISLAYLQPALERHCKG